MDIIGVNTHSVPNGRVRTGESADLGVAESTLLCLQHVEGADVSQLLGLEPQLGLVHLPELGQEPGVHLGILKDVVLCEAVLERL